MELKLHNLITEVYSELFCGNLNIHEWLTENVGHGFPVFAFPVVAKHSRKPGTKMARPDL